jgi:hypothetical protein
MTIQVSLYLSPSGRLGKITTTNGRIIAEFLIKGYLLQAAENAIHQLPIEKGKINIFRGEIKQLAPYEYLDTQEEDIFDRPFTSLDNHLQKSKHEDSL